MCVLAADSHCMAKPTQHHKAVILQLKAKDSVSGVSLRERRLPCDSAVELPAGFPQLGLSPRRPSHPWGLPLGASGPNYPLAFGGSLTRGSAVIFAPVLITVSVEGKKNVT